MLLHRRRETAPRICPANTTADDPCHAVPQQAKIKGLRNGADDIASNCPSDQLNDEANGSSEHDVSPGYCLSEPVERQTSQTRPSQPATVA